MVGIRFHRAAVAIFLVATLLAPFGTCKKLTPAPKHTCCLMAANHTPAVRADCCSIRTPTPAVVTERTLSTPVPLQNQAAAAPTLEIESAYDLPSATIVGPHSPPPGASVLRI